MVQDIGGLYIPNKIQPQEFALLFNALISQTICRKNFSKSSFSEALSRYINFCSLFLCWAINKFSPEQLYLTLHPNKVSIETLYSGVDFLGWVHFPDHRVPRTATKRRMIKKLLNKPKLETAQSYLGLLKHGNTHKLKSVIFADF